MSDKLTLDGDLYDTLIKAEGLLSDQWDAFNNCLAMYIKQQLPEEDVRRIYESWKEDSKRVVKEVDENILRKAAAQPWTEIRDMGADLVLEERTEKTPVKTYSEILGPATEVLEKLGYNIGTQFNWEFLDVCRHLEPGQEVPKESLVDLVNHEKDNLVDAYLARALISLHSAETVEDEVEADLEWNRVYDSIFHALNLNADFDAEASVNRVVDLNDEQKNVLTSLSNLAHGAKTARELYAEEAFYMIMAKGLVDGNLSDQN